MVLKAKYKMTTIPQTTQEQTADEKPQDQIKEHGTIEFMSKLVIRDPETNEILLQQRVD